MQKLQLFLFAVLFTCLFSPQSLALHVVIDPGHGGTDKGAHAHSILESTVTLQISKLIAQELKAKPNMQVTLTRNEDIYLSLEERAEIGNKVGDIFLSIHANSSADPRARGHEIYFQNQLPPDEYALFSAHRENQGRKIDTDDIPRTVEFLFKDNPAWNADVRAIVEDLARSHRLALSSHLAKELYFKWGGEKATTSKPIRQAPFFVISNLAKPSALVEVGYLTNPKDAQRLTNITEQKKIAQGVARAVLSYKEFVDKNPLPSLK